MSARANGDDLATHQGDSPARTVTSNRRPGRSAAERKRDQRARDAKNGLLFERQDWMLFLSPATLPQKAGCQPGDLRALCCARSPTMRSTKERTNQFAKIATPTVSSSPTTVPAPTRRTCRGCSPSTDHWYRASSSRLYLRRAVAAFLGALAIRPGFDHERDVGAVLRGDPGVASVMAGGMHPVRSCRAVREAPAWRAPATDGAPAMVSSRVSVRAMR